ncbi:MAG TPA: hypothetical protein VE981_12400 [Planctomycetota bacterium]|nr:hypothetical protein [Planctomycetota bacterium]
MRGTLDPLTQSKIAAFARRRRRFILIRGICAVVTILLATMTLLAIVDRFFYMPDEARYAFSGLAYVAAFIGAWFTCARLVWRSLDPRELARLIEAVRPDLREDLISAVELGDPHGQQQWESEEFREILQGNVARRMQSVSVSELLSFHKISAWVWVSTGVIAAVVSLLCVPGLSYDRLLLRALDPFANIERVSRVKVRILLPNPAETSVPQGDIVTVRVETEGPETKHVYLESFPNGKKTERVEMALVNGRQFESSLAVGRDPMQYRIRAGDAMTRKYTLTTVPRPEAISFRKNYVYPEYAHRPNRVAEEETGDLVELEGSVAELFIKVNQDVKTATLKLESGGKPSEIALKETETPRVLRAQVPLTASGTYRVHLVSQATGFTNKFSPQYEIRCVADLVPRIVLEEPTTDLLVPPDEVVAVKGSAKDDIGLAKVLQAVKVNAGDWKETAFPDVTGTDYKIGKMWDVYDLRVQPGDQVALKLVAVDLKGNRAESAPVHLTISARGFDPQRLVPLAAKEGFYSELIAFRDAVRALDKRVAEAAGLAAAAEELQRKQAVVAAIGEVEKVLMVADGVETRAKDALRVSRTGREGGDLILAARLVKRLKEDTVQAARAELEKGSLPAARELAAKALDRANALEEAYKDLLACEEAIASLNDVKDLARDQQAIHRQLAGALTIKDPKAYERLARRQGVAAAQIETVEGVLQVLATRSPAGLNERVAQLKKSLAQARTNLKDALGKSMDEKLNGPSQAMNGQVQAALNTLHGVEQDLARRAEQARGTLDKKSEPSFADIQETSRGIKGVADLQAKDDKSEAARLKEKEQSERATARWKAARAQLEARAGIEEVRKDSDPFFVADSSLGGRAMQSVLDDHLATPKAAKTLETLAVVEKAYRTLETGHALAELSTSLRELSEGERWTASSGNRTTRHPKDWQWMDVRMGALPDELKAAGLAAEQATALSRNWRGPAGDAVRREMAERHHPNRNPQAVAQNLERLSADLGRALSEFQPLMDEARKALQKLVPSLAERLEKLSEAAKEIQKNTAAQADKAPQTEAAQTKTEAAKLLENQQAIDKQIEEVVAELRRDANTQDLFTEKGRERARDADDAVAMLRQSPPKAEDLLNQAAATPQPKAQEHALDQAAEQQGKLKDALHTLAEHYKNLANAKPEETRPELRKAEEALGLKQQLDQQYAQMERLAELAQQSPESLKAALENQLKENEAMQRELNRLTQNALDRAEQALNQAAQQEQQAAQQQAAKTDQEKGLADKAKALAEEARRMAREDVAKVSQEAAQANAPKAQQQAEEAKKDLNQGAADIPQNFDNAQQAAQDLNKAAQDFNKAAQDLRNAQKEAQAQAAKAQTDANKENAQAQAAQQKAKAEMAEAQQAQAQADQAQQQAAQAQQAAQEAQRQAQQAPQDPGAQQKAQQAQKQAQAAQQKAEQAAQKAGAEKAEAQAAAQKAQAEAGEAQQAQKAQAAAQQAAQDAGKEAGDAQDLAKQAQALAQQFQQAAQANAQQAQAQQAQVAQELQGAQADIQQAARNEQSLGEAMQAQQLGQVAQGVQDANQNQVAQAAKAAQQGNAPEAAKADQAAQAAIEAQAKALADARGQQGQQPESPAAGAEGSPLADAAAEFLAQALNALNGQGKPEQGQGQGKPEQGQGQGQPEQGQGDAAQAMAAAAQAQAAAMRQGRTPGQGQMPGQNPMSNTPGQGKGASVQAGPQGEAALSNALLKPGDWGKLPPRLARDLMQAQREPIGGEYRHMVETYFQVVAEKAREKK